MKQPKLTGTLVPQFTYDTPQTAENDFYALCAGQTPLVLVFLPNFGHPISRAYLNAYSESLYALRAGRLACVVRSDPSLIAARLGEQQFDFTLICDAEGVLYDYFGVRETSSLFDWTFAARRIIKAAKKEGYHLEKGEVQLLPLTLVLGEQGRVLYAHRGRSLTDLPEDCEAIEAVCQQMQMRLAQADAQPDAVDEYQGVQGTHAQAADAIDWFDCDLGTAAAATPAQSEPAQPDAIEMPEMPDLSDLPQAQLPAVPVEAQLQGLALPALQADDLPVLQTPSVLQPVELPDLAAPAPEGLSDEKLNALLADLAKEQQTAKV